MEYKVFRDSEVDSWKEVMLVYSSALKEIGTKKIEAKFHNAQYVSPVCMIPAWFCLASQV